MYIEPRGDLSLILSLSPNTDFENIQAAKTPDASGFLPLHLAGRRGASEAVKSILFRAWPSVIEGASLQEAIQGNWGCSAVEAMVRAHPEMAREVWSHAAAGLPFGPEQSLKECFENRATCGHHRGTFLGNKVDEDTFEVKVMCHGRSTQSRYHAVPRY